MNCKTQSFTHIPPKNESLHHPASAVLSTPKDSQLRPRLLQRRHLRRGMGLHGAPCHYFSNSKTQTLSYSHSDSCPAQPVPTRVVAVHNSGQIAGLGAQSLQWMLVTCQNSLPSTEGRPCPGALMESLNNKMAPLGDFFFS